MSCENGNFLYSFFILLTQWHEFPAPKLTNFHVFIIPLPLNVALISKNLYLFTRIEINNETGCIECFSEKKNRDVSRAIATAKMELFVTLATFNR